MKIIESEIIDCAKTLGFNPSGEDKVSVFRPNTIHGTDLGEWWVYLGNRALARCTFRVTDEDIKLYLRDRKIKTIING